jgi:hypothetical protein
MGTWLNGASANRETKNELPRTEPERGSGQIVRDTIARAVLAEHQLRTRADATGFLDRFLRLFADYSFSSARSHRRSPPRRSNRTPAEILAELNSFYAQRPRPWRPGSRR